MLRGYYILLIPLFALMATSCDFNRKEKAMRLSNELGFINDSLYYYGKIWNDELKVAVNILDFSRLKDIRLELEDYIGRKMEFVKNTKDIGSSEELREAELRYLEFEKEIVHTKFAVFEKFDSSSTTEELAAAYENLLSSMEDEKPKLDRFYELQEAYAEKYDFPKPIREM